MLPQTIVDKIFDSFSDDDLIAMFNECDRRQYDVHCSDLFWRRRINRLKRCCYIYEHAIPSRPVGTFSNFKHYIEHRRRFLNGEMEVPTKTFLIPTFGLSLYNVSLGHNYCVYYNARVRNNGHTRHEQIVINKGKI